MVCSLIGVVLASTVSIPMGPLRPWWPLVSARVNTGRPQAVKGRTRARSAWPTRGQVRMRRSPPEPAARPYICLLIILKVVDASLDGAGVPAEGQAGGDGVEVLLEAAGER